MIKNLLAPLGFLLVLAGCGGGDSAPLSQVEQLRAQALAKEAEARTLAVDQPCLTDSQCGALSLLPTDQACTYPAPKAYSLVSPTASQAEAAAAVQRSYATQLMNGNPPSVICPAIAPAPPVVACEAQKCVVK
jgi:hypothetical protein